MRPVFVGNFGYDTRQVDLERLFSKYGVVERVDMKSVEVDGARLMNMRLFDVEENFVFFNNKLYANNLLNFKKGYAFVHYEDERDADDAIRKLENCPFGYDRRKLSVEWARGERGRARDAPKGSNQRPTKTLFVINFDPIRTRVRDLERHFEPYGKVLNVRIRKNFAFVQLETLEDAIKALESTNMSKLQDRVISVEYALRDDDERDERERNPVRGGYGRSPYRRSPSPLYSRSRPSPVYGRSRPSPDYGRPRSPVYDRYDGPAYDRRRSPVYGRIRSRSPIRRSRT
ncbi:hypothetical protein KSS87_023429 [Heliosperma pusillum]|nr:hypothetical protein KSS87_023429 [Heliosperma pusillum]